MIFFLRLIFVGDILPSLSTSTNSSSISSNIGTVFLPCKYASIINEIINLAVDLESSFEAITLFIPSGDEFVSTTATIGIPKTNASLTAFFS